MKKEALESKPVVRFYKSIGDECIDKMMGVEKILGGKTRSLKLFLRDKSFVVENNHMHYEGFVSKSNEAYLSIAADKEIGKKCVSISLEKGITGFDIHSGERYDRKLARVSYDYDGKNIKMTSLQDENDILFVEEAAKKQNSELVSKLQKRKNKRDK